MTNRLEQLTQFIRLGYADVFDDEFEFRSLHFQTDELTTEEAQHALKMVKSYNAFNGPKTAKSIEEFKGRVSDWRFGREGDPVLYVRLPYTTNQAEGQIGYIVGPRIPEPEHNAIFDRIYQLFTKSLQ